MILFKNTNLYTPQPLGKRDVLFGGGQILAIAETIDLSASLQLEVVDAGGKRLIPGLVDGHVHIAGAGGEGGPATRTPEVPFSMPVSAGVTSVVGCLGTDGFTRDVGSLIMKAKGLKADGLSCWCYTGSYQIPARTFLDDVARDISYIEEIIGVGEIAVADHRSSAPQCHEMVRLAKHARIGGMLGAKAGVVHVHMGDSPNPFHLLYDAVAAGELKFSQFYPTHINRNAHIFEDAKTYGLRGPLDITTSSFPFFPKEEVKPSRALKALLAAGVPAGHIGMSSDAGGSLPKFDGGGRLVGLDIGSPDTLMTEVRDAVLEEQVPFETALATITANPARTLKLAGKGVLQVGADADAVLIDDDYRICHVVARGVTLMRDGKLVKKGTVEVG